MLQFVFKRVPVFAFPKGAKGGLYLPSGNRWEDAAKTQPADTVGDQISVWEFSQGTSDAVAPQQSSRPELEA